MAKKEKVEEKDDDSELESDIEKVEEEIKETETSIDNNQFHEFLKPSVENISPVLEQVEVAPPIINLEQDVWSSPHAKEKEDDEFKYHEMNKNQEEPKYEDSGDRGAPLNPIDRDELRKNVLKTHKAEIDFSPSSESNISESRNYEKFTSPERIDIEKAGREPQDRVKKYEIR